MQSPSSIDMFTPTQVCDMLDLCESALLEMVNQGRLAAYNIGGAIRFKSQDVHETALVVTAA